MVDFFITGNSFTTGDIVTAAKLNDMVNKATPKSFNRDHFDTSSKIITNGPTAPSSPAFGEVWADSSNSQLNSWDGSDWTTFWPRHELIFTAQSTISAGDVVVVDEGNATSVQTTSTAQATGVVGIATSAATSGNNVKVCLQGTTPVTVTGTTAIGDWLETSTTAGSADPQSARAVGSFARALTADADNQVDALLLPQSLQGLSSPQTGGFGTSGTGILTFSRGSGTMVSGTWYQFPGSASATVANLAGSPVAGTFHHDFTTTRNNQLVFVTITNFLAQVEGGSFSSPEDFEFRLSINGSFPAEWTYTTQQATSDGEEPGSGFIFPDHNTVAGDATIVKFESVVMPWIISTASTTYASLEWRNVSGNWSNTVSGSGIIRVLTDSPI